MSPFTSPGRLSGDVVTVVPDVVAVPDFCEVLLVVAVEPVEIVVSVPLLPEVFAEVETVETVVSVLPETEAVEIVACVSVVSEGPDTDAVVSPEPGFVVVVSGASVEPDAV